MWPCVRNLPQFLITALKQRISLYFRNQQSSTGFANHYFNEYYAKIRKLYLQCQERRCHVRADINHDKKIILVWKSTQELDLPVPDELECDIRPLREKKYKLIIMKSGTEDLFESTLYLLKTNRMKIAQQEARAELMAGTNAPA